MTDVRFSELPFVADFTDALEWAVNDGGISRKVSGQQVRLKFINVLGFTQLAASAHESAVVSFTPRRCLAIPVGVTFYTGTPDPAGDIASLRFNGDTGNNYWSRHAHFGDGGVWNKEDFTSTNLIRLAETNSRLSRNVLVIIANNLANRSKTCNIKNQTGTNDASVAGSINTGGGEWVNTTAQISSVQLVNAGSNNIGTGSGFAVLGIDFV